MHHTAEFLDATSRVLDYRDSRDIFSQSSIYQAWLDIEAAVAAAQGEMGMIPAEAASVIVEMCDLRRLDQARIEAGYRVARHPLMPLLDELVDKCGEAGRYVHWGIATQNIQQTGTLYLAQRAHRLVLDLLADCLTRLADLADQHAEQPCPGRTHGQHAVPSTLGFKFALWIDELLQAHARLKALAPRVFIATMGGAVGFYSAIGPAGPELQRNVSARLGMHSTDLPSRSNRAHMTEYAQALALACTTFHKIAEEVALSSSEELGELFEGVPDGVVGSSTMPQKVNPKMSMGIIANCHKLYGAGHTLLAATFKPFEGDAAANMIFDQGLAEVIEIALAVCVRGEALLANLIVDTDRARSNLELSNGGIYSEHLMMKLAASLGKKEAHDFMYAAARDARASGRSLFDVLDEMDTVRTVLDGDSRSVTRESPGGGMAAQLARDFAARAREIVRVSEV